MTDETQEILLQAREKYTDLLMVCNNKLDEFDRLQRISRIALLPSVICVISLNLCPICISDISSIPTRNVFRKESKIFRGHS